MTRDVRLVAAHSVLIKDDAKDWLEMGDIEVVNDDIDTFVKEGGEFLPSVNFL